MRLTYLQMKVSQKMRNNLLKSKQTSNKTPLMFLDVKVRRERGQLRFWTLSTKKEDAMYVCSV